MPLIVLALVIALSHGPAPADEYFGPHKASVLEIRNRLQSFERDNGWDLSRHVRAIDDVELAIEDWHHKYPRDPWLRGFTLRLERVYRRAHAVQSSGFRRIIRIAR
jgi:hypothetical protein